MPLLASFAGRSGMLRVIDTSTIAMVPGIDARYTAAASAIKNGCACTGLVISSGSAESLQITGALRWLRCADTARIVRKALDVDQRHRHSQRVLLVDILDFARVSGVTGMSSSASGDDLDGC